MNILTIIIRKIKRIRSSHSYIKAIWFLMGLIIGSAVLMYYVEKGTNSQFATLGDGLWWAVSTVTTVGYGDRYPVTGTGRLIAAVVMVGGIGSFGFIAGSVLEEFMKRGQGRMNVRVQNHFVICSYNYKAESIVKEIQKELPDAKIVLIADREENPMIHKEGVYFVRGDSAREAILEMAHVSKASTVIILADSVMSDQLADAHSVLTTLAVKELNPTCRVVAESLDPENTHHLTHAGADEIVCIGDITARLISRSSIHRGMTHLVAELMSSNSGNELYSVETPDHLVNLRFEDAFAEFRNKGAILVGTYLDGRMISNPPSDTILDKNAILIYIANAQVI